MGSSNSEEFKNRLEISNLDSFVHKKTNSKKHKFASKIERRLNYLYRKADRALRRKRRKEKHPNREQKILVPLREDVFYTIEVPRNFSLLENTEEVLGVFKRAAFLLSKRMQIEFNLEDVENITPDAIALLIAKIKDESFTRGLTVKGNKPKKKEPKQLFDDSGFLEHVRSAYVPPKNEKNLLLHQVSHKKVHPLIARQVCELAVRHSFGDDIKFAPIYKIMIECMANTDNHANVKSEGVHNWWIFTYCNPVNNVTSFTFLDLGVGIYNSNPVNRFRSQFLTATENLTNVNLTSKDNLQLVPSLFSGDIYTSRTKDKKRGQGLPSIKELSSHENIKNFIIIANNVKTRLPQVQSEILKNKFNGTLLYWELHPINNQI